MRGSLAVILLGPAVACGSEAPPRTKGPAADWPVYAGDAGGRRYSPLDEITPENVAHLELAWEFRTGDLRGDERERRELAFQATPILVGDSLYLCTPRSRIVALDPETGEPRCVHEPPEDRPGRCRGVAFWSDAWRAR
jgi:quinoprotein glucose dehydrogenase